MTKARRGITQVPSYGDGLRRNPFAECKAALRKVPRTKGGIQYVEQPKAMAVRCSKFVSSALKASSQKSLMRRIAPVPPNLGSRPRTQGTGGDAYYRGASEIGWSSMRGHFWWPLK
jgi:hypothetical protein